MAITIGQRIKLVRGKESQDTFAQRFGIHRNTLSRWENDERPPDITFLQELSSSAAISSEWLLTGEGEMASPPLPGQSQQTVPSIYYGQLIDDYNDLRQQNSMLWPKVEALTKENGELKVEIERLKAQLANLSK